MERLTEKHYGANDYYMTCSEECERDHCVECAELEKIVNLLGAYEDTGLTPAEIRSMKMDMAIIRALFQGAEVERLKELAAADKEGRVVVLPCKVGQRVFALLDTDKHISECEVKQIGMGNKIGFIGLEPIGARGREYGISLNGFGKTVFRTREEAEKALEAMKDD